MRKTIDVIDGTIEITIDGKTIEIPVEITIDGKTIEITIEEGEDEEGEYEEDE